MYQCMKNSQWFIIDCDNLVNIGNGDIDYHRFELIIKLVDLYTNTDK